jgi:nitrate reductase gamma subunit
MSITHRQKSRRKLAWLGWLVQCALLCALILHAAGVLDTHSTPADQKACVACQVADNQALDLPDTGAGSLLFLLVLLFLIVLRQRDVASRPELFRLPHSRAPPVFA